MWVSFLQSEFYHWFCLIYREMSICTALINGAGLHSGAFYLSLDRNIRENNRQGWFMRSARSQTNTLSILCSNSNSNFNFGLPLSSWINELKWIWFPVIPYQPVYRIKRLTQFRVVKWMIICRVTASPLCWYNTSSELDLHERVLWNYRRRLCVESDPPGQQCIPDETILMNPLN